MTFLKVPIPKHKQEDGRREHESLDRCERLQARLMPQKRSWTECQEAGEEATPPTR